jgi:dTDP-glucose pyrophosphorylase
MKRATLCFHLNVMPYNNKIQKIRMLRRCADLKEGGSIFGCPVKDPERHGVVSSSFVQAIQERQRLEIVCIEEIAFRKGHIDRKKLQRLSQEMANEYGQCLMGIVSEGEEENHDAQSRLDRFNPAFQLPFP